MDTNCAPLVAYVFLFCYVRDFVLSLPDNNQANVIEAFNSYLKLSTTLPGKSDSDVMFCLQSY